MSAPKDLVIELVDVKDLQPAAYNPRESDPERLELLALSLRKLGFILPIYATPDGHLLSGHQRLKTAVAVGATKVPVVRIDPAKRRYQQVNLLFNRITNDMKSNDTSAQLFEELRGETMEKLLGQVKDKQPDTPEFYPCMQWQMASPVELLGKDDRIFLDSTVEMCKKAHQYNIFMPVVMDDEGRVMNGVYRLMGAANSGYEEWPYITLPALEAKLAERLTNLISMNFTLEKQYANVLRYGAYRRPQNIVHNLVRAMRFWADGCVAKSAEQSLKDARRFWASWRRIHGEDVLDFGAGQCRNELILSKKGVRCTSWEPYAVPWDEEDAENKAKPSIDKSRRLTDNFLQLVANKHRWSSIFMNAVLNSVPFHMDRMAALSVVHACCSYDTVVFGTTASLYKSGTERIRSLKAEDGKKRQADARFKLDYEPNVVIADIAAQPKVQKYHTEAELREMLERFWVRVVIWPDTIGDYLAYKCSCPRRINPVPLAKALEHEFNLPYDTGETLNRHNEAFAAFSARHGVTITSQATSKA